MQLGRAGGATLVAMLASGCAIVGPLYDRQMHDAPRSACIALDEAPAPTQCFALIEEWANGTRREWSGGTLQPGRTLLAIHQAGRAGCGGRFSHLTVTGSSDRVGQAELATWDGIGRPGHSRRVRWNAPFVGRTYALASIDSVMMAPGGARIRVLDGSFDPASLCLKSY